MKGRMLAILLVLFFAMCAEQDTQEKETYQQYKDKISMVIAPAREFYELSNWENAYALARENGVSISNVYLEWGEIELSQEVVPQFKFS